MEHLYPDTLKKCVETVFGQLKPRLVLITTPNRDFNVVFGNEDPTKFRHWDHKFEWSRQEFQSWCQQEILAAHRDYDIVFYSGLGEAPAHLVDSVGHCTQLALFQKKTSVRKRTGTFWDYIKRKKRVNIQNRMNVSQGKPRLNDEVYFNGEFNF